MNLIQEIAVQYHDYWLIFHLFAMVVGLGGASYTDLLLVTFLKDLRISKKEKEVIHTMSTAVTVGVFMALFSGVMLFLENPDGLLLKSKFIAKVVIFGVLMINGFLLHRIILPRLLKFDFHCEHYVVKNVIHLRKLGFVLGAISGVSWYFVFLLGALSGLDFSVFEILGFYSATVLVGIIVALLIESRLKNKC